jgi:hypothetical protein
MVELTGLRTPCALIDRFKIGLKRQMVVEQTRSPAIPVRSDGRRS